MDELSIPFRYLEWGKYFSADGASDYVTLASSPNKKQLASTLLQQIPYPKNTPFSDRVGNVSIAVVPRKPSEYVFLQLQRRKENELNNDARTVRYFNQIRYIFLKEIEIYSSFAKGKSIYHQLLEKDPYKPKSEKYRLRNYLNPEKNQRKIVNNISLKDPDGINVISLWHSYLKNTSNVETIKFISYELIKAISKKETLQVYVPNLDLEEKLLLVQAIQRLIYPKIGPFSFALDYIIDNLRTIQLQFFSDEPPLKFGNVISINYIENEDISGSYVDVAAKIFIQAKQNFLSTQDRSVEHVWKTACQALYDPLFSKIVKKTTKYHLALSVLAIQEKYSFLDRNDKDVIVSICELADELELEFPNEKVEKLWENTTLYEKKEITNKYATCILEKLINYFDLANWIGIWLLSPNNLWELLAKRIIEASNDEIFDSDNLQSIFSSDKFTTADSVNSVIGVLWRKDPLINQWQNVVSLIKDRFKKLKGYENILLQLTYTLCFFTTDDLFHIEEFFISHLEDHRLCVHEPLLTIKNHLFLQKFRECCTNLSAISVRFGNWYIFNELGMVSNNTNAVVHEYQRDFNIIRSGLLNIHEKFPSDYFDLQYLLDFSFREQHPEYSLRQASRGLISLEILSNT